MPHRVARAYDHGVARRFARTILNQAENPTHGSASLRCRSDGALEEVVPAKHRAAGVERHAVRMQVLAQQWQVILHEAALMVALHSKAAGAQQPRESSA